MYFGPVASSDRGRSLNKNELMLPPEGSDMSIERRNETPTKSSICKREEPIVISQYEVRTCTSAGKETELLLQYAPSAIRFSGNYAGRGK